MSQIGRTVKNLEAPRPLKTQTRSPIKNYMLIEDIIQLIENVAIALDSGINNPESMALLVSNLRIHGPQLESISKDTLDRAFVTFRNASQDERLNLMTRLNLLELIELRAKSWQDDGINTYYKHKATNVEPDNGTSNLMDQNTLLSTSPTSMAGGNNTTHLLGPGELIRTSGKFPKPTKIPGKNYSKDEVVIRNADSGKVNPGAKERLVQITGPNEEKINYAKQLIEDTIRRNASPVRLEPSPISGNQVNVTGGAGGGGGSCSSLASSASDETAPRATANRNSIGTMLGTGGLVGIQNANYMNNGGNPGSTGNNKLLRSSGNGGGGGPATNQSLLLHSYSTNDASLGEYKYTVNVGQHILKITGDCCELVRVAKLVLDDYFSSNEFLASVEVGASFDSSMIGSTSTPSTPLAAPFVPASHQLISSPFADSGVCLNYMAGQISNTTEGDDDVFTTTENASSTQQINGLARSRRSHFSRKDSAPDGVGNGGYKIVTDTPNKNNNNNVRIVHEYERLIYYSKSPHSWALPKEWIKIAEKYPTLVRNKVKNENASFCPANNNHHKIGTITSSVNNNNSTITTKLPSHLNKSNPTTNIIRKGFFNRATFSIDEGAKDNSICDTLYLTNNNNNINNNKSNISNNNNNNANDVNKTPNNNSNNKNDNSSNRPKLTIDFRSNSTCD